MKILFVCTGNSCRSPMAAALFDKMAKKNNSNFLVDNCGTATLVGMSASKNAIDIMRREDIDISAHKSKPINKDFVDWADLILTMEERHREKILQQWPASSAKVFLLTEFAKEGERDIVDPIGKPPEVYEGLLIDLQYYLPKVIERLKNESSFS